MPTITITKLYDLISIKLGKETAENLTIFIEEKIKSEVDTKASTLATKEDVAKLSGENAGNKAELLKWMFIFWASQLIAMFGFLLLFLKK
jgi:hypothetical protein